MSTSGSTDFSLNSRQVIDEALRLIGALQEGDSPTTARANEALNALNMMLKTWGGKERLWLVSSDTVTLIAGQATYTLSTSVRRVTSVRRRVASLDTPMIELSRSEYDDLPTKSATGTPNSWYFDKQRVSRTLSIWPTADATVAATYTLPYTYVRIIDDCDTLDNDPDVPSEWLEVLVYNLAKRLGPRYGGIDNAEFAMIAATADDLLKLLPSLDQEEASMFFQPGYQ